MLCVLTTNGAFQNKRLIGFIFVSQMNKDPLAFHMIQKHAQFGVILFLRAFLFKNEAILSSHRKAWQRIPDIDGTAFHHLDSLSCAQLKIMRACRFVADEADAHF
jgi:hypothetical protein